MIVSSPCEGVTGTLGLSSSLSGSFGMPSFSGTIGMPSSFSGFPAMTHRLYASTFDLLSRVSSNLVLSIGKIPVAEKLLRMFSLDIPLSHTEVRS